MYKEGPKMPGAFVVLMLFVLLGCRHGGTPPPSSPPAAWAPAPRPMYFAPPQQRRSVSDSELARAAEQSRTLAEAQLAQERRIVMQRQAYNLAQLQKVKDDAAVAEQKRLGENGQSTSHLWTEEKVIGRLGPPDYVQHDWYISGRYTTYMYYGRWQLIFENGLFVRAHSY